MAMKVDMAIAEKRAIIRAHINDLSEAYGVDWGTIRAAKTRLQIVAGASRVLARLTELEAEMASLLATQHDIESSQRRAE